VLLSFRGDDWMKNIKIKCGYAASKRLPPFSSRKEEIPFLSLFFG
jgi:hypothetical protein